MVNYIELAIVTAVFITAFVLLMLNYLHDFSGQTTGDDTDDRRLPENRKPAASGAVKKRGL